MQGRKYQEVDIEGYLKVFLLVYPLNSNMSLLHAKYTYLYPRVWHHSISSKPRTSLSNSDPRLDVHLRSYSLSIASSVQFLCRHVRLKRQIICPSTHNTVVRWTKMNWYRPSCSKRHRGTDATKKSLIYSNSEIWTNVGVFLTTPQGLRIILHGSRLCSLGSWLYPWVILPFAWKVIFSAE